MNLNRKSTRWKLYHSEMLNVKRERCAVIKLYNFDSQFGLIFFNSQLRENEKKRKREGWGRQKSESSPFADTQGSLLSWAR